MKHRRLWMFLTSGTAALSACVFGDLFSPKAASNLTVAINADSLLTVGDTVRVAAAATGDGGSVSGVRFTFASSRPAVATVDDSGRVAVLARDTFTIRATLRSGSLPGEAPTGTGRFRGIAARVVAAPDSLRFESLGDTARATAQAQRKEGGALGGVPVTWASDRPTVVSVDSAGLVRALDNTGPGRARVIVTADGRRDTVVVAVQQISRSIALSRDTLKLTPGDTFRLAADARDARGNPNTRTLVTWSTAQASIATVDTAGLVRAVGEGITRVVANSPAVLDTAAVIVARGLLSLQVTPDSSHLTALNQQVGLDAQGVDTESNPVGGPVVLWRTLDPNVATVDQGGVVTAVGNGTARLVGESGGQVDTVVVTVDQVLAGVAIVRPSGDTTLTSLRDTVRLAAEGRDANGHPIPGDRCCAFSYQSDNPAVAAVDPGGLVTGLANGDANLTAEAGGFTGGRVVHVAQRVAVVYVLPERASVLQNQRLVLSAAASDARGNSVPGGFNWSSKNNGIASPLSNGSDTVTVQAGNVTDSTFVVADRDGRRDSVVFRVGPLAAFCAGGTTRTGNVSSNQTWTRAASPHCVGGSIVVQGGRLTIEAGATVKFAAGAEIQVGQCCSPGQSGSIRALGTGALPITFTALDANPSRGQWGGIRTHWVAGGDSLVFRNAVIEYGGAGAYGAIDNPNTCQGNVVLDLVTLREGRGDAVRTNCALTVSNSVIENNNAKAIHAFGTTRVTGSRLANNYQGLAVGGGGMLTDLTGTRIVGNRDHGLILNAQGLNAVQDVPVDSLIGNAVDEILISGNGDLTARDLFMDRRLPWLLDGVSMGIGGGRTLRIDAGSTLRWRGATLRIGQGFDGVTDIGSGRIIADGTTAEIRLTSGDPNPQPGQWGFIWLKQLSDTSVFRNVVLEYGGPCCAGGHIFAEHTGAPLVLDRVTSRRSLLHGLALNGPVLVQGPIYADSNAMDGLQINVADVTLADSRFVGNGRHGLSAGTSAARLRIDRSTLALNGNLGAEVFADNVVADANEFTQNGCDGLRVTSAGSNPQTPVVTGNLIQGNGCNGLNLAGSVGPQVENNLIADNGGVGAIIHNGGTVRGNRIRGNQYPAQVNAAGIGALASQDPDSLLGNQRDTLWIQCCGDVTATDTIHTTAALPWRFDAPGNVRLVNGTVWKLEPGATVVMNGGILQVDNGTIRALGEPANPIRFTSDNRAPGAWSHLDFQTRADTSVLRHVEFRYGGGAGGGSGFTLRVGGAPSHPVVLDNVRVTRSSAAGIQIDDETIIPTRVVADSNAGDGMRTQWNGALVIPDGAFSYNGGYGLFATSEVTDNLQVNGGTFTGNSQSGIKLCGDGAAVRNAALTRNFRAGLEVEFGGCPGGSTLENYVVDGVRADSNGNGIIYLAGSAMRIRNSRIVGNAGTGVRVGSGVDEFTGNRVTLNGGYPMSTGPQGLEALEDQDADSMLGNATDQILVDKNGTIGTRNVTIRQRLPWRVQDGFVTVGGGRTLGVEPGTTIVMDGGGAGLWIGGGPFGGQGSGRLLAEGTTTDPIRFVAATPATRWHVLAINQQSDTSKLRHVSIEHGGNSGWPAALTIGDALGRPVILDAVTVRQSAADGINANILAVQGPVYADSNGGRGMVLFGRDVTLTDARFMGNGSDGLWTSQSARNLSVRRSLFYRNGAAGAHLNGDSTTMDSSTVRRNGSGLAFCCDGNNPLRPRLLRSTVDSNLAHGVSTSGSVGGIIQDNLIAVNGGTGLVHHNGGLVTGNRIRGNGRSLTVNALALGATTGQSIDSLLGNVGDTLTVECCSGDEEVIAGDTIRTRPELPWRVDVGLRFINRTVWKVEPGSSVFLNGGRIQIGQNPSCDPGTQGAVLLAESDDAAPIRFTSRNPTRGAWSQILLECLSDTVRLRNVEVSYAGSGAQDAIRIAPGTAGVRVVLDSVRVRQSAAGGLLIQTGTNVLIGRYLAADSTNSYGLQVDARDVAVPAGRFTANQTGIQVFGRRFSLANAAVSGNGPTGIEIHADSATITGSTVESNGGSGILANCCTAGHALNGLLVQNNAGDGLRLHASSTSLTGNTVVANGGYGVFGDQYQTFSAFTGNTVSGNGNYPVLLDGGSLGAFAGQDQAALLGNGRDTLCICSGPSFAPFTTGSPTLGATLPWRNQVSLVVGGDQTLTVEPGATLVMDNGAALFVGTGDGAYRGRLLALGTAANPVRVMGRDTTVRGFWHQLAIQNQSDSSILRHVELVGGGGTSSLQQLYAGDLAGLPIRLDTVTVRKSATHGVWFGGSSFRINGLRSLDNQESGVVLTGGAVTLSDSRLESNGFAGLRVDGGGGHVIGGAVGSILAGNGSWGVYNGTADLVTATMNWWGHGCGPGCNGTNPVFGNVDASAPLAAPPGIP